MESLFLEALELSPGERRAFLQKLEDEDPSLGQEIRALLSAHEETGFVDGLAEEMDPGPPGPPERELGAQFGPYQVDSVLGQGGMGVVYRAHRADGQFRQEVALKVLPADLLSSRNRERFLAEREILARLSHPNVARLQDGGVDARGRPYFAMELVEGRSILDYCDAQGASLRARLGLFILICEAVQHAHQNLVVHRDLKPGNILVTDEGDPKLLDFGIGKILDASGDFATETQVGFRLLTPAYAAPEQLRGAPANTATDIYQLGILLFELLTGAHPFPERRNPTSDPADWERTALDPTRPSVAATTADAETVSGRARARATTKDALSRALRGDLDAIVLKALRHDPQGRYSSAVGIAEDVRRFLQHRPVRARRDSRVYRARLFARRNRAALAVSTAGVVGISAFVLGIARESQRTALERDRAQAVSNFMTELFASADPVQVNRAEIAVRDVLDDGLERVRADESMDPSVRMSLLLAIGQAYNGLGLHETALDALSEVLALMRGSDGVSEVALADALAQASDLLTSLGRFDEARPMLERADSLISTAGSGADPWGRAQTMSFMGTAWLQMGEPERASAYKEEAANFYLTQDNAQERAAGSLGDLALIQRDLGDPDSAAVLYGRAVALREEAWGGEHLSVTNSLVPLGELLLVSGRLAEADIAFRRALEVRAARLPEDHPGLAGPWMGLAKVSAAQGDTAQADSLFQLAVTRYRTAYGPDHYAVGRALNDRAIFRQRTGRMAEAEADYRQALDILSDQYGSDHPYTLVVTINLAWAAAVNGNVPESITLYDRALPVVRRQRPDDPTVYGYFTDYGIILCLQGRPGGEPPLRTAVEQLGRLAPLSDRELRARNALGSCLMGLQRNSEAIQVLEGVLVDTQSRPEGDPYRAFAAASLAQIRAAEEGSGRDG
ncbi:MAG: serine/threonine-protein kinase [Gemmatimonadota bacterium]|nr:serine/threonine-protein kinase [Gemmatimonadota bacterium]